MIGMIQTELTRLMPAATYYVSRPMVAVVTRYLQARGSVQKAGQSGMFKRKNCGEVCCRNCAEGWGEGRYVVVNAEVPVQI